jgi:tRNA(Ile)-lysidine synthase
VLSARSEIDPGQIFSPFDFAGRKAVVAAVSGGSDSLAMLLLLRRWLERRAPQTRLIAVTVDHRLRPEAQSEAEGVARLCVSRGIAHRTLAWTEQKPDAGLAAAGRLARYALLAEAAKDAATDLVVTGHTADDQAETVAMRQARGDGRGLAGMAPATLFEGRTWILRPLLRTFREDLRGFLRREGIAWIEDPSNVDLKYERPRVRADLGRATDGTAREELLATAKAAASQRIRTGRCAAELIDAHVTRPRPGLLKLAPGLFSADEEAAIFSLRVLLAVTGGVAQLPDAERVTALAALLESERFRATLARTAIDRRKDAAFLYRERRGLPPPIPAVDNVVWDGRYVLNVSQQNVMVAPAGETAGLSASADRPDSTPASLKKAAFFAEPCFFDAGGAPLGREVASATPILAPWCRFLPSFDISVAEAVSRLLGAPETPPLPWAGHNGEEA